VEQRNEENDPSVDGLAMHAADLFSGIDLMFTGHVHRGYYEPWEDPINHTIICQTYGNGSGVGEIVVKIDKKTKTIAGYNLPSESGGLVTLFEDEFPPENEVAEYIAEEQAIAEEGMDDPIGSTKVNLVRGGAAESIIGRVIMDAFRAYYDSDFSFSNVGGIRAEIPEGEITLRQLFTVMPFGNQLVRMQVKGSFVRKIVEQKLLSDNSDRGILTSGAEIVYNKTRPKMDRITKFLIRGEPLDPDRIYDVVTTDYLSEGNSGLEILLEIPRDEKEYTQIPDIDVVAKYITENSPLDPKPDSRFKRDDTSEQAAYLDQTLYQ
jgi:2',3'-cyclic-nucleotide 2'-phosphodiesterase (5'-nucleotidase family)